MLDSLGRNINYVRISITDRCNLRCLYCMPSEGVEWLEHSSILSFEEILRLARLLAGLGISRFKLTGGEPLVRKGATGLVRAIKQLPGVEEVTLTSNGQALGEHLAELADIGLDGLNISLDTLDPKLFEQISRRSGLEKTLSALRQAISMGFKVKVNCVPMRGVNEQDFVKLVELARHAAVSVRFIEMMPIGHGAEFSPLPSREIMQRIEAEIGPLTPFSGHLGNGPARYYNLEGFKGKVGFISAISHMFCSTCNRLRLTADGFFKPCLASDLAMDFKPLLRNGASDNEITEQLKRVVLSKPQSHLFLKVDDLGREKRNMSAIGG